MRRNVCWSSLFLSHFLGGCTNRLGFEGRQPGDVVIGGVCSFDFACNDALFCNGEEYCGEAGLCVAGEAPCSEGLCLSCQENTQSCFEPADTACDDSDTSTYSDICDGAGS
ncbi:hypothetical protein KAI87_14335, partial [Myxococcota bacterium]|nr:hypothetical protein [Myxococcota bacterium]